MKRFILAIAICILSIGQSFNIGQVYASNIADYRVNKTPLDISVESSGIEITLKEAKFDSKYIEILYEVNTDRDLGETIFVGSIDSGIHITAYDSDKEYWMDGYSGSGTKKSGQNKYVGKFEKTISDTYLGNEKINYKIDLDTVYAQLHIDKISYKNIETDEYIYIDGVWNFPAIELKSLGRSIYNIDRELETENAKLNIKSIEISPIQFAIVYTKDIENIEYKSPEWENSISFEVKDDLGKTYNSTGGYGYPVMNDQFENLNKDATKITISPEICVWREIGEDILNENGESVPNVERKYITFDSIEIDSSKL